MSQFSDFDFDMSGTFQSWEAYAWSNPSESVPLASSAFSSAVPVFHHVPYTCSMQPSANHEALHGRELGDIAMPGSNPASSQMPVRSTALISQNTRWKRAPTSKDWTTHRSRITELYKDHTLPELREILRQETGFAASYVIEDLATWQHGLTNVSQGKELQRPHQHLEPEQQILANKGRWSHRSQTGAESPGWQALRGCVQRPYRHR
jgi:hypothetical protein